MASGYALPEMTRSGTLDARCTQEQEIKE